MGRFASSAGFAGPLSSAAPDLTPFTLAYQTVEALLMALFPDGNARRAIGFRQISRLVDDRLAWYLWTDDRPGAYLLELSEAPPPAPEAGDAAEDSAARADLLLRYYPHPDEPAFADASPVERRLRRSALFDGTGTPTPLGRQEIDPALFLCGVIRLAALPAPGPAGVVMALLAQTEWREVVERPDGPHLLRRLPGWALSFPLFDKLVLAQAYVHRLVPAAARAGRLDGMAWARAADHTWSVRPEPAVEGRSCVVVLSPGETALPSADALAALDGVADPTLTEEVIAETLTAPTGRLAWIEPAWWQAHRWTFAPDAHVCHHCFAEEGEGHEH